MLYFQCSLCHKILDSTLLQRSSRQQEKEGNIWNSLMIGGGNSTVIGKVIFAKDEKVIFLQILFCFIFSFKKSQYLKLSRMHISNGKSEAEEGYCVSS